MPCWYYAGSVITCIFCVVRTVSVDLFFFFFQAEDGIRDLIVTGVQTCAFRSLRHQRELDTALELDRADPRLHDVLRLGAYQLRWLTRVPSHAAVSTSVELARETVGEGSTGYVNRTLRHLHRDGGRGTGDGSPTHPDWLVQRWIDRYGKP